MSKVSLVNVENFINPHVFWIIPQHDIKKRRALEETLKSLRKDETPFEEGQLALVYTDDKWKRGLLRTFTETEYRVWLYDYACYATVSKIYKLPQEHQVMPCLVKQAALDSLVNVKQVFGPHGIEPLETEHFCIGTVKLAKDNLQEAQAAFFLCAREVDNVHIGKLTLIQSGNKQCQLANLLIKSRVAKKNVTLFETALQENLHAVDVSFLSKSSPCVAQLKPEQVDALSDISLLDIMEAQGCGRGVRRDIPDTKLKTPQKKYVEDWLGKAENQESELEYESDSQHSQNSATSTALLGCSRAKVLEKLRRMKEEAAAAKNASQAQTSPKEASQKAPNSQNVPGALPEETAQNAARNEKSPGAKKENIWEGITSARSLNIAPAGMNESPLARHTKPGPKPKPRRLSRDSSTHRRQLSPKDSSSQTSKSSLEELGRDFKQTLLNDSNRSLPAETLSESSRASPPESGERALMRLLRQNCTRGCKCDQCNNWDAEGLELDQSEFSDTKAKKTRDVVKPPPLLRTKGEEDVELESHVAILNKISDIERAKLAPILVHGTSLPFPTTSITAVPFHKDIHRALRKYDQVFTLQSYVWPSIMRHNNICMVGGAQSGKTFAYLPAVCSYLLEREERYEDLPDKTVSPIVLILCPGSKAVDIVLGEMIQLMNQCSNKPSAAVAVSPLDKKCLNQFQKQCDVLIATPPALISLLQSRLITMKKLCHLVMESAERILDVFSQEISGLLGLIESMLEHRHCNLSVQVIAAAEHWSLPLENLVKQLNFTPVVCIGAPLEAALYGRVDIQTHFLEAKSKAYKLAELLKEKSAFCKTVVICNDNAELEQMKDHLNIAGVNAVYLYDGLETFEIASLESNWKTAVGGKYLVLMCTEQVFCNSLVVTDAVCLIHYSLPVSWTQFSQRFSCLLDNYISPLCTKPPPSWVRCKVHIFIDESCKKQFPKLLQLLKRMGADLPPKFIDYYKQTVNNGEEEKLKAKLSICPRIMLFGKCDSDNHQLYSTLDKLASYASLNCPYRHVLSASDCLNSLPKCGIIRYKIKHVQDVTTFTVKLLEHTSSEGETTQLDKYSNLHEALQKALTARPVAAFDVKLRQWYAHYSDYDDSYHRCVVEKILLWDNITKLAHNVRILYLDSGLRRKVPCSYLYELPTQFKEIPQQGIDIVIANALPPDSDSHFSSHCKGALMSLLQAADYQHEEIYGVSQILLQLGSRIWVKNVHLRKKLEDVNTIITVLDVKRVLKARQLASLNPEPLEKLYAACRRQGIALPDYKKLPPGQELKSKSQAEPQWAHFGDGPCHEVYIACVEDPGLFYVRLKKFYDLFDKLQKEIQETVVKPFYPTDVEVLVDHYYLAKDEISGDYCRVKICSIADDVAKCFYVDFGDFGEFPTSEIKFLPDELIVKLPFQVIECRLYGIEPVWGEWEDTAIDVLNHYTFEPDTDYYRTLYVTTCKQEPASATGGQRCAVLLVDNFTEKVIVVNKLLVECGEAVIDEEENLDVQFSLPEPPETAESVEEVEDIENKELTLEEVRYFSNKYKKDQVNNNIEDTTSVNEENTEDEEEHTWDIEINDAEAFMKSLLGIEKREITYTNTELPPIRAAPSCNHCTPDVLWYQTDSQIVLSIMLIDVGEHVLRILKGQLLFFRTVYDGKEYKLELHLYGKVDSTFAKTVGQSVKVTFTKSIKQEWPRLLLTTQKRRNVRYDVSRIVVPEEKAKPFLNIKDLDDGSPIPDDEIEHVIGSDDDSESDIDYFSD